ncbi:LamG domain-containing protein [bacterium]|nr:LamG domain-containing protein [bacterium]
MATSYSPKIVTDGLVLCVDAAHPKCFKSPDDTATDLAQGFLCTGANGTPASGTHTPNASNFPAYNSINGGVFDFVGGKGINIDGNLGNTTASSISMWFYKNSTATQYFTDGRNNGGGWFLSNYTGYNIIWNNSLRYKFDVTYNAASPSFINKWIHMVVVSDSTGSKLFINGAEVDSTTENSADEDFGINYRIGTRYTTSDGWSGYMGPIHLYNKRLSAEEVSQNYNASKSKFGL